MGIHVCQLQVGIQSWYADVKSCSAVQVSFEPPRVSLPGGISLAVGPTSSVVLSTTYLDERVRLGKGGRGSRFVFTRGGACEHAGKHSYALSHKLFWGNHACAIKNKIEGRALAWQPFVLLSTQMY